MNRRRPLAVMLALATLALSACSVQGSAAKADSVGSTANVSATTPSGPTPASLGRPTPLVPALTATGKAVMKTDVVHVDLANVSQISPDGSVFTMTKAQAAALSAGTIFVVNGIASRKVTALTPGADAVQVHTVQATPDEIFKDLDVTFDGVPDATAAIVNGAPVMEPGSDPALQSEAVDGSSPAQSSSGSGTAETTAPPTTKLRAGGLAFSGSACKPRTVSLMLSADPITVTPSITTNADCSGFTLNAEINSDKGPVNAGLVLQGGVTVIRMKGHLSAGASGNSQSAGVQMSGALNVGGKARAEDKGGFVRRFKMTWDLIKVDYGVIIDGVPFVVRIGVPIIFEFRFSGQHDTVQGKYIGLECNGLLNVGSDAASTSADICKMAAAGVDAFTNIAPSAFVVAAGFKVGFGPGIVVGEKAVAFAGITATLAASVGISSSGATSTGLLDCIQMDRSVQLNVGVEAVLGPVSLSANRTIREKKATNSMGSRCPKS